MDSLPFHWVCSTGGASLRPARGGFLFSKDAEIPVIKKCWFSKDSQIGIPRDIGVILKESIQQDVVRFRVHSVVVPVAVLLAGQDGRRISCKSRGSSWVGVV